VLDEQVGHLAVAFPHRVPQSRPAPSVREVDIRRVPDEGLDDSEVAHAGREVEAGAFVVVRRVRVDTTRQQQLHALHIASARQLAQLARHLRLVEVQLGFGRKEHGHHFGVPFAHRLRQRGATPPVHRVDVRICRLAQVLHHLEVTHSRGEVQARALVFVRQVGVAVAGDEELELLQIARPAHLAERLGSGELIEAQHGAVLDQVQRDVAVAALHRRDERPVPRAVLRVHVGLVLDEGVDDELVAHRGRHVQPRPPVLVGGVEVDSADRQHLHALQVAVKSELDELCGGLGLVVLQLGAALAQHTHQLAVPLAHRVAQRRAAPPVLEVDVRARVEQQLADEHIPRARRQVEAHAPVVVRRVRVDLRLQHRADLLDIAAARQLAQLARALRDVQHGAVLDAEAHHLQVSVAHRLEDWRVAPRVDAVDVGVALHEHLHRHHVAHRAGEVQRGALVVRRRAGVAPRREQQLQSLDLPLLSELAQLARGGHLVVQHLGAALDHLARQLGVSVADGEGERRHSLVVLHVHVGGGGE